MNKNELIANQNHCIVSAKVLAHFDPQQESIVTCDASSYGLGAVVAQKGKDGKEHPVAYASITSTKAERNYAQVEREALAVDFGLQRFHQYLFGREFVLQSQTINHWWDCWEKYASSANGMSENPWMGHDPIGLQL